MTRRYDIDALRVFAFAILILYHVSGVYQVDSDFHIVSSYQYAWLDYARIVFNRWRMPLLFAISGIAIGLTLHRQGTGRFMLVRSWRLLLPLVFGMLFVVSVQAYCEGVSTGMIEPGYGTFMYRYLQLKPWPEGTFSGATHGITWTHLWYLAYLWTYTLLLAAVMPLLRSVPAQRAMTWLGRPRGMVGMLTPALVFFAYLLVLKPRFPETHALLGDWYLHAEYFTVFLLGFAVAEKPLLWSRLASLRRPLAVVAVAALSVELSLKASGQFLAPAEIPAWASHVPWGLIERSGRALYMWSALLAIFGWGHAFLNRPFRWLPYATEAVYPWYILHQSVIVLAAYWLIPLRLGAWWEPALVLTLTTSGCLLLHELVIRRTAILRPLFGLKAVLLPPAQASTAERRLRRE